MIARRSLILFLCFYSNLCSFQSIEGVIVTGEIYSLDNLAEETVFSLEVRNEFVTTFEQSDLVPAQRFMARTNTDNTFNLFLEHQPWNWVNYIVESSLTVNIKETPQILDVKVLDGIKNVIQADYRGSSVSSQKWYLVPTPTAGDDSDIGLVTNLLHRQCITNNGAGNGTTIEICNPNDSRQLFQLSPRTHGRCYK